MTHGIHRGQRGLNPRPFLAWVDARREQHRQQILNEHADLKAAMGARDRTLDEMGWLTATGQRREGRWRTQSLVPACDIIDALDHAGVDPVDVYPELEVEDPVDRWCGLCGESVLTDSTLVCPWCEHPTTTSLPAERAA
jgi:hypothetical protein